jgi:signal peptidase I
MVFVGDSMSPTYRDGQYVLTFPADGELERGDVVVVQMPDGPIVKRVAFLPGDVVPQIRTNDGWSDMIEVRRPSDVKMEPERYRQFRIPEGQVYLLGDNRPVSLDSREFGPVPREWVTRRLLHPRDRVK